MLINRTASEKCADVFSSAYSSLWASNPHASIMLRGLSRLRDRLVHFVTRVPSRVSKLPRLFIEACRACCANDSTTRTNYPNDYTVYRRQLYLGVGIKTIDCHTRDFCPAKMNS